MNALDKAIGHVGGAASLAEKLGIWNTAITNWKARGRVPATRCIQIETATAGAVTRYDLRPDIFGPAPDSSASA